MLATLCDYPRTLALIQDSGIQFLDFGLAPASDPDRPARFVRQSVNGPLLYLDYDDATGKHVLTGPPGAQPEIVKPEFGYSLAQSLALLDDIWLPLPFFRCNPPRTFLRGPDNWARVRIKQLNQPDQYGHTHRICLAFDTKTLPEGEGNDRLAPDENDGKSGVGFSLAYLNHELGEFLDETWVDGWLREVFIQRAAERERRNRGEIDLALRTFEYQAHYLNMLRMLGDQLSVPTVRLCAATLQTPAVKIDLILDVGNSHTCGILVEEHAEEADGLKYTAELQLRDLGQPQFLYNELFESRVEFARAAFGKQNFSMESGRDEAFTWPSITRVGREAIRLALARAGTEGATGVCSPRRYLWDEQSYPHGWRFADNAGASPAAAVPLSLLLNDEGDPLFRLSPDDRLPVLDPHYSRSALMTLMLTELLAQAQMQINSAAHRLKMPQSASPRQLRHLILTLPSALPKPEREIFRRRMDDAIALFWKAMGWHPADEDFTPPLREQSRVPVPDVQMEWDEATCGQMVYLYNETRINFAGRADAFFADMARPDKRASDERSAGKTLRIASIDIGGGTTDLAVTEYRLADSGGPQAKISPTLLFREGFKVAGDDILRDVIRFYIMPGVHAALERAGLADPAKLMDRLFGDGGATAARRHIALHLWIPAGRALLEAYEHFDPLDDGALLETTLGELLCAPPATDILEYVAREVRRESPNGDAVFAILQTPLVISLPALHEEFFAQRFAITRHLRALAEVVAIYDCDILLLTGRPARLPGVQALFRQTQPLPVNRILSLDGYHTSHWYPFNVDGRIANPKSTAAVGAMLCLLALNLRLPGFYFNAGDFQPYSTLRYLGMLNDSHLLTAEHTYYADIDLDRPDFVLDPQGEFILRGPIRLGFRQLDNDRWPASPLYTLSIADHDLARNIAGDGALYVKLAIAGGDNRQGPERFVIAQARLADGRRVPAHHLRLALHTLYGDDADADDYWIDSGSLFAHE
ncbi:virulence factor SrfB [Martelella alba]|uniref:Virulence factor SrfB n=1 Tax=Martelella alba TaxID=2590451 RepID=A0ABY2SGB1_9HYPH|nr:virulence factor SrfB [Martelella alba]TKI03458.1 virulence factor SrfB [Martelella alba]